MFIFANGNKPCTELSHSVKYQPLKCMFSLWNSSPKKPKFEHRSHYYQQYSAARPRFHDVIRSERFCRNGFQKSFQLSLWFIAALDPILYWVKHAPNSEIKALKTVKLLITRKRFCWPCEGWQDSYRFFSFPPISSQTEWRHINTSWLSGQFQNGGLRIRLSRDEFLQPR